MAEGNGREQLKRRSSILKVKTCENSDGSPPQSRRVSFAEKMKVKTFDETGCNTSEIVSQPDGSCDMSLVNSTATCEHGSAAHADSSVFEKSFASLAITNDNKLEQCKQQPSGDAVIGPANGINSAAMTMTVMTTDNEDSDDGDETCDIMRQISAKGTGQGTIVDNKRPGDLKKSAGMKGNGNAKINGQRKGTASASAIDPNSAHTDRLEELSHKMEALPKLQSETNAQWERIKNLADILEKRIADLSGATKNRTVYCSWK